MERKRSQRNEFEDITAKSVKIPRPPRRLDPEFTRLTHPTAFTSRKIYSEEKARPREKEKGEKKGEVELLTFYQPRQQRKEKAEENN